MDPVPQITRIFRCREGFALVGGGGFRTGELVFEDHPAVREFPTRFEPEFGFSTSGPADNVHLTAAGRNCPRYNLHVS